MPRPGRHSSPEKVAAELEDDAAFFPGPIHGPYRSGKCGGGDDIVHGAQVLSHGQLLSGCELAGQKSQRNGNPPGPELTGERPDPSPEFTGAVGKYQNGLHDLTILFRDTSPSERYSEIRSAQNRNAPVVPMASFARARDPRT